MADMTTFSTGVKTQFLKGKQTSTKDHLQFATVIRSGTSIEAYPIADQLPKMREWIGARQFKEISMRVLRVVNRQFENSLRVNRNMIADDQYQIFMGQAQDLGTACENVWDDLAFEALTANKSWVDNKPFFTTDRKYGKRAICNTGTEALNASSYEKARATMRGYVGEGDTPLCVVPDTIIVGPALEGTARKLFESKLINDNGVAVENPWAGTCKVLVSDRLVGDYEKNWYLACTKNAIKPILVQIREESKLSIVDKEDADHVVKYNENLYTGKARGEAALLVPHLIYAGIVA